MTGTKDLLWVSNTESDVFRLGKTGPVYYLVAGRWFSAPDFTGPWTFATPKLPDGLQEDSARARTLARAGVGARAPIEAIEAVLLAQIPQTARVEQDQVRSPAGELQRRARSSRRSRARPCSARVNTDKDIIQAGAVYYYCSQGVWFTGKSADWAVAGRDHDPGRDLQDPRELAVASRHLRRGRGG